MEESSNGRLEETLKVEAHDEESEVALEDPAASKPDVEFVRGIISDGNLESVNKMPDGKDSSSSSSSSDEEAEPEERSPQLENSENFEEEKVVSDSVVESVEPGVSLTEELSLDIEPSVEKSGDLSINGLKEDTEQLSYADITGNSALLTKGNDKETTGTGLDETKSSKDVADVSCLAKNVGVPAAAVAQGITETKIPDNDAGGSSGSPDLASKENVEVSLQAANVPIVETRDAGELVNKPETSESTGNQPLISLTHRPAQPTSWKSCCGLFEVLRRSDR
ncbi:hypothetical protein REPUB_Repub09cG0066300 [Reevesia pubescens]